MTRTVNSRAKGKRGELELSAYLREKGYDAHRGVQYKGGADSPDVVGLPGVHIEVKRTEKLSLYEAMEQAIRDAGEGEIPVVVHRRSRKKWVCVLPIDDFLQLYKNGKFERKDEEK